MGVQSHETLVTIFMEGKTMKRPSHQFRAIFNGKATPVLEQVAKFNEVRQALLAGNIANTDTPLCATRDLDVEHFKRKLAEAIERRHGPGFLDSANQ